MIINAITVQFFENVERDENGVLCPCTLVSWKMDVEIGGHRTQYGGGRRLLAEIIREAVENGE